MALKGMEAYMDSEDEGDDQQGTPSSYSAISTEEGDHNGNRSQEPPSGREAGPFSTPRSQGDVEETEATYPKTLYGFPHNLELRDEEKVRIPDDTPRACSNTLEEKVAELIAKQKRQNLDVNYEIQKSKAFRNPSIYQKLIEYCEIDEFGSNFDPTDFDPKRWTEASSMESLAKAQSIAMEKYEREKKAKGGPEVGIKRKTKWDSDPATKTGAGAKVVAHGVTKVASSGNLTKTTK